MDKSTSGSATNFEEAGLTPELIREIADKVYLLLLQRLQIEQERDRLVCPED